MNSLEASKKLKDIGETAAAAKVGAQAKQGAVDKAFGWPWKTPPKEIACWTPSNHVIGFIAAAPSGSIAPLTISHANNIEPDPTLKGKTVKITLDRLRVACYPGTGGHNILFNFAATHQGATALDKLEVNFTQNYQVTADDAAGINGFPVFLGLKIGSEGLVMTADTVNVSNVNDVAMLAFMNDGTFQQGLQLINTTNPVMPIVTKFATGIFNMVGHRNDNIKVQHMNLGLDFSTVPTQAKLREGAYVLVQSDVKTDWKWEDWKYYPDKGEIRKVSDGTTQLNSNYMIFGISKMNE